MEELRAEGDRVIHRAGRGAVVSVTPSMGGSGRVMRNPRHGVSLYIRVQVVLIRPIVDTRFGVDPKRGGEVDVDAIGDVSEGDGVDIVTRLQCRRPDSRRFIKTFEPLPITIDSLISRVGDRNGRAGVGVVCVDIPLAAYVDRLRMRFG